MGSLTVKAGQIWKNGEEKFQVLSVGGGWAMCRKHESTGRPYIATVRAIEDGCRPCLTEDQYINMAKSMTMNIAAVAREEANFDRFGPVSQALYQKRSAEYKELAEMLRFYYET